MNRFITLRDIRLDEDTEREFVAREFKRRASVTYQGGGERLDQLVVTTEQRARWRVRQNGIRDLSTSWTLVEKLAGGNVREWKIIALTEPPGKPHVWWDIHTEVSE